MLTISLNLDEFTRSLDDLSRRQLPYALALALNRTAEERQHAMRERIVTALTVRHPSAANLFRQSVRFAREDRADIKKAKYSAEVKVIGRDTPAERAQYRRFGAMILRHEEGGRRTAQTMVRVGNRGMPAFYLPANRDTVRRADYPRNIGAVARKEVDGRSIFAKSKRRTRKVKGDHVRGVSYYTVPLGPDGRGVIFKRWQFGNQMSKSQPVWWLKPTVNLRPQLNLAETFYRGAAEQLRANLVGFLGHAISTAKR